jgi:hypothetical protein
MNSANSLLFMGRAQDRESLELRSQETGSRGKELSKIRPSPWVAPKTAKVSNCGPKNWEQGQRAFQNQAQFLGSPNGFHLSGSGRTA